MAFSPLRSVKATGALCVIFLKGESMFHRIRAFYHRKMAAALENNLEDKALYHLQQLALLEDDWGLNALGCRYITGKAVEQDYRKAYECFDRAAGKDGKEKKYAEANIASMYLNGQYVNYDEAQAAKWFCRAAEQGHPPSQYNWGLALVEGWMGYTNVEEGVRWLEKASNSGITEAADVLSKLQKI